MGPSPSLTDDVNRAIIGNVAPPGEKLMQWGDSYFDEFQTFYRTQVSLVQSMCPDVRHSLTKTPCVDLLN